MRALFPIVALAFAAACGDPPAELERVKQEAAEIGGAALEAATDVVDTRTACMLAGQSEAFCGCVQQRLGADLTREHVEALTGVLREASSEGLRGAAESARNIDPAVRDAVVQCATTAAVQGAIGAGEN